MTEFLMTTRFTKILGRTHFEILNRDLDPESFFLYNKGTQVKTPSSKSGRPPLFCLFGVKT